MPHDFLLISGDDNITISLYTIGTKDAFYVLANAYPEVYKMMKAFAFCKSIQN